MNYLAHLADRVLGKPLLVHPKKAELVVAVLGTRIGVEGAEVDDTDLDMMLKPAANRLVGEPGGPFGRDGRRRTMYLQQDGVAIISIVGSLVNRGAFVGASSGLVSYEGLSQQIEAAAIDPSIRAVLLDIDSPGGEANGAFAFYEVIRAARAAKPITAFVNDMAASAAYGIAANSDEIVISQSSIVGSIGVVMVHMDVSAELAKRGRKPTLIYAGAHKVDGNSFEPLSDAVRADLQREVDGYYDRFVEAVAAGRSRLSAAAIRATEARTFNGSDAIGLGLADRIANFAETLTRLSTRSNYPGGNRMNAIENQPRVYSQDEHDAALAAARTEATTAAMKAAAATGAAAVAEATAAATAAAIARVRGILGNPEAAARMPQAIVLALDTDLSVEAAGKIMGVTPASTAPAPRVPPVADRSAPNVGTEHNSQAKPDPTADWLAAIDKVNAAAGKSARH